MDPELGCQEEKEEEESLAVRREREMKMRAHPKLPRSVAEAERAFMSSYPRRDYATARRHLRVLKDWFKGLKSLPPLFEKTPDCLGELNFASIVLQFAVLMAIAADEDPAAFDEEFDQLKPYYACTGLIPPSPQQNHIFGYYLLRLLEKNRIADFHAELKSLSATEKADPYIQRAVKVEKLLSECQTLDCKFLRQIYREEICGRQSRNSYIPSYVERVMFPDPSEKPLPCVKEEVDEEEVIARAKERRKSRRLAFFKRHGYYGIEKRSSVLVEPPSVTGPREQEQEQEEDVLSRAERRGNSMMSVF